MISPRKPLFNEENVNTLLKLIQEKKDLEIVYYLLGCLETKGYGVEDVEEIIRTIQEMSKEVPLKILLTNLTSC